MNQEDNPIFGFYGFLGRGNPFFFIHGIKLIVNYGQIHPTTFPNKINEYRNY